MAWWNRILNVGPKTPKADSVDEDVPGSFVGGKPFGDFVNFIPQQIYECPPVRAAVDLIVGQVAGLPPRVFDAEGVMQDGHPALRVFTTLNPHQLFELLFLDYEVDGNAFLGINRGPENYANELVYIPPPSVQLSPDVPTDVGLVAQVIVNGMPTTYNFKKQDFIHFHRQDSFMLGHKVASPLLPLTFLVGFYNYFIRFGSRFYKNNAADRGLYSAKLDLTDPAKIRQAMTEFMDGVKAAAANGGSVASLSETEFFKTSQSMRDADFVATHRFLTQSIYAYFAIPAGAFGVAADKDEVSEARALMLANVLAPRLERLEWLLTSVLLSPKDRSMGLIIKFDRQLILQETFGEKVARLIRLVQFGIITPNEARKELGKTPLADANSLVQPAGTGN